MNKRLEILVEERSMEVFLQGLLPRILPEEFKLNVNCFIYPHEGKSDLQKRLPKRLNAYPHYPEQVMLMVLHDQDSADCVALKRQLQQIIENTGTSISYVIRIACRELENWYLGDLNAVEQVYSSSKASRLGKKKKYRTPDRTHGSKEMQQLAEEFMKIDCARKIATQINIKENQSESFRQFLRGLSKLTG